MPCGWHALRKWQIRDRHAHTNTEKLTFPFCSMRVSILCHQSVERARKPQNGKGTKVRKTTYKTEIDVIFEYTQTWSGGGGEKKKKRQQAGTRNRKEKNCFTLVKT